MNDDTQEYETYSHNHNYNIVNGIPSWKELKLELFQYYVCDCTGVTIPIMVKYIDAQNSGNEPDLNYI